MSGWQARSRPDACAIFSDEFGRPRRVVEAVRGEKLPFEKTETGWRVAVPEFQIDACVVAEY